MEKCNIDIVHLWHLIQSSIILSKRTHDTYSIYFYNKDGTNIIINTCMTVETLLIHIVDVALVIFLLILKSHLFLSLAFIVVSKEIILLNRETCFLL